VSAPRPRRRTAKETSAHEVGPAAQYEQRPVIEQVPQPQITRPLEAIVRIGGAGLCRTDLHIV
jgi:D-arabinose 1-dehydrogenase-like Zn-dependent alcohol dehydrogenase